MIIKRKSGFIHVSGSSVMSIFDSFFTTTGGVTFGVSFVTAHWGASDPVLTRMAFGFGAAPMMTSEDGSGDGVIKSFSARAPSRITDPSLPTAETTVRVYAVPGRRRVSRVTRVRLGFSVLPERESIFTLLASDCFTIFSFSVSRLTGSENITSTCASSCASMDTSRRDHEEIFTDQGAGTDPTASAKVIGEVRESATKMQTASE